MKQRTKRFALSLFMGITLACLANAETVTVGFEEYAKLIGDDDSWKSRSDFPGDAINSSEPTTSVYGAYGTEVVYQSGGVKFNLASDFDGLTWWSGTALSTRKTVTPTDFTNDTAAVTGRGYESDTYAVVSDGTTVSLPTGALITGLFVTNTAYAWDTMSEGNTYSSKLSEVTDGYFKLTVNDILSFDLGRNSSDSVRILDEWGWFDLTSLNGATELVFSFSSNVDNGYGPSIPFYFAFDNLTYTLPNSESPEPATLLIFGAGLAGLGLLRRKRK